MPYSLLPLQNPSEIQNQSGSSEILFREVNPDADPDRGKCHLFRLRVLWAPVNFLPLPIRG